MADHVTATLTRSLGVGVLLQWRHCAHTSGLGISLPRANHSPAPEGHVPYHTG